MSGGNPSKNRSRRKQQGWEEAGGEFYQESYPGGVEQELLDNLQRTDASKIATLLPSKQVRAGTVKRVKSHAERKQSTTVRSTVNRDIHISMLPDLSAENLSNEERTWEEIMQIKAMPIPMSQKIELKAQLQSATKLRLQGLDQLKWKRRVAWQGTKSKMRSVAHKMQLWRSSFRNIEGNFGTGVVAYFLFLKWLFFLNLALSAIIVAFIIVPTVVLTVPETETCEGGASNSTECCSEAYFNSTSVENMEVTAVFQGTGWMEKSPVFYGLYMYRIYDFYIRDIKFYYNMPVAYLAVILTCMIFSLCAIVKSASRGFKDRLIEGEGQFYQYCNLVFGGWDYCIQNPKSAAIKHRALHNEMKGCLEHERLQEEKQGRSRQEHVLIAFKRIFVNVIVVVILSIAGAIIYYAFNYAVNELSAVTSEAAATQIADAVLADEAPSNMSQPLHYRLLSTEVINEMRVLALEYLPSLCIVSLNLIVPILFAYLVEFESYAPSFVLKISLFRTVFLRLASLVVLISQMYMFLLAQESAFICTDAAETPPLCWETYVGQQIYKLFIADFVMQVVMTFVVNFPRAVIAKRFSNTCVKFTCEQEFYLPRHVLDVVYSQTLCWLGVFYCPVLPLIAAVFGFFIFYMKKFACLVNSTPSATVYRASRSKSFFMVVLLISFFVAVLPLSYAIAELHPSRSCGPFRTFTTVWTVAVETFDGFPNALRTIVFLLGTSIFAIPAFILLILMLYYYWAVADANRHMVGVLKSQLVLEGHDKQFLLNRLSAFIRQQQKRSERLHLHAQTSFADEDSLSSNTK